MGSIQAIEEGGSDTILVRNYSLGTAMTTPLLGYDGNGSGLPPLPRLIFFDTNIVQNLHSFGELIYDNYLSPEMEVKISNVGYRFTEDIYALADFMALGRPAGWPIAISPRTLAEIEASPRGNRYELSLWGNELAIYFTSSLDSIEGDIEESIYDFDRFTYIQRCRLSEVLQALPQESDRQLIIDAREFGCDIFLTMDYKTIWRHRDEVKRLGVQAMRPVELLEYISPWAGLLA